MIVTLKKGLGLHIVEAAIRFYERKGFDVLVSDNGELVLAVVGRGDCGGQQPFGVKRCMADNTFLFENPLMFCEAWQYLAARENGSKKKWH